MRMIYGMIFIRNNDIDIELLLIIFFWIVIILKTNKKKRWASGCRPAAQ